MRFALALVVALAAGSARADCDHFKWSVAQERGWFAASPAPLPAAGGMAQAGRGYALTLDKNVKLPTPPERAPKPETFAAVVEAQDLAAGVYQITLSDEAWIDVVQNGVTIKSGDFSGQRDCPDVHKSVRFTLSQGAAMVEISNSKSDRLMLAIAPAR